MRKLLLPVMVLGLLSLAPAAVWAGQVPGGPDCEVSDDTVQAGGTTNVLGQNWFPNTRVSIKFAQEGSQVTPIDSARADNNGMFNEPVTIPNNAQLGPASIICKGRGPEANRGGDRVPITVVP